MRILHISTRLILGGSQENTILSCEGQARLGHDVHLAFGPIYGPEGSLLDRAQKFRTPDGRAITTHTIPHMVREVSPIADYRGYLELKRLIRAIKPDIVHTHSSKAGIIGRAAAWSVPRVELNGTEPMTTGPAPANWAGKEFVDPDKVSGPTAWKPIGIIHTIHGPPFMPIEGSATKRLNVRLNNTIYTIAERFAARRCHIIASVADAMTAQFLARGIGRADQYTTVYSGMETSPYLNPPPSESRTAIREQLGLCPDDFVMGTVARLAEHKGHDDLLTALADDLKAHPNWKLLWVGDGWWRDRLIGRARQLGLAVDERDKASSTANAQLILTGLVPPDRVPGLIRAMDVLIHPSYREGLPRTVPQALLAGVAPIAYDVDGTGEVCRDGQTGLLIPPGDLDRLRAAARRLYDHPDERRVMADRGRHECAERFSASRMVDELEIVYRRALDLAARAPR